MPTTERQAQYASYALLIITENLYWPQILSNSRYNIWNEISLLNSTSKKNEYIHDIYRWKPEKEK